jgi:hypothetical protein
MKLMHYAQMPDHSVTLKPVGRNMRARKTAWRGGLWDSTFELHSDPGASSGRLSILLWGSKDFFKGYSFSLKSIDI